MNNVKLGKRMLGFVFAAVATFTVSANEVTPNITAIEDAAEVGNPFSLHKFDFSKLLSVFDLDKNGALSKAELSTSDSEALKSAFKSIDSNDDESISADEFRAFNSAKAK